VELLGFQLTRASFHTALFELNKSDDNVSALRRCIETLLANCEQTLSAVAAEEDSRRVAVIINTDAEAREVLAVMERVRAQLAERGFSAVVSLSHSFGNLAELPDHFAETEEQIRHQAFFGTEKVIYDSNRPPRSETRLGHARETEAVVNAVRAHDSDALEVALEQFERTVSSAGGTSIGDARYAYFSLADTLQSLLPGHDSGARQAVFRQAQEAPSSQELLAMVGAQAQSVMARLDALRRHQHSDTVRRAAAWIEEHLGSNISVDNVAEAVFLSSRYLNSLFRSEMRQTVFEYICTLRIKRAESLLTRPRNLQIQEIAHAVGYYNVQSFIRLFKRYHGVTPAEFRRSYSLSSTDE
jgi:two-component system response regulator YesN